jgi:hypothetical protein
MSKCFHEARFATMILSLATPMALFSWPIQHEVFYVHDPFRGVRHAKAYVDEPDLLLMRGVRRGSRAAVVPTCMTSLMFAN